MSKKRKRVEIESDLNTPESRNENDYGVVLPNSYDSTLNSSGPSTENNNKTKNDGQSKHLGGDSESEIPNSSKENKVFDEHPNKRLDHPNTSSNESKDSIPNDENHNEIQSNQGYQDIESDPKSNARDMMSDATNKVTDESERNDKSKTFEDKTPDKSDNTLDITGKINHLRDFSKIKNMSKQQAKQEVIEISKEYAKKKLTMWIMTYIGPFLIPLIIGILAILLFVVIILAAITGSSGDHSKKEKSCGPVNNDTSVNITASKDGVKNAEKIYEYEMSHVKGAKPKSVAAHIGNMAIETGHTFDPKIIQNGNDFKKDIANDPSVGGYAMGIAQWDSGRRVNLIKYAEKEGKKWDDLGIQLNFLLNHDGTDSDLIKKLLKSDASLEEMTDKIMTEWERAGDKSSLSQRKSAASKYYAKFSKKDVDTADGNLDDATDAASDNSDASENSGCSDTDVTGGSGEIGESVKANGHTGRIIKDWNSKNDIPQKYRKYIKLPDFKESVLDSPENVFPPTGNKGQCTELTWGYMKQMYGGKQPTNGNGNVIYKAYKAQGAKTTANPTVGYGFSSDPPYAGAADGSVGHTGIVVGVLENGDWIMANYNLHGEGNNGQRRHLTYALVDGNKKSGGIIFFEGIGKAKIKSK